MSDEIRPLYDSRAVLEDDIAAIEALRADGFERRPDAVAGVVYLRKHISGPVNPDDGQWR